jgi:hypothetical protein
LKSALRVVACVVSLRRTVLWLLSLAIFDKAYANATAGRVPSQLFPDCCKPLDD